MLNSLNLDQRLNNFGISILLATLLAYHGYRKKSLALSGAVAAFLVGFSSFFSGYRFGIILIMFYYSGSQFTKIGALRKAKIEDDYVVGGMRNYRQVFACSILATVVAVLYAYYIGPDTCVDFSTHGSVLGSLLWSIYISHYACAAADTWASELGVLSPSQPVLVTSLLIGRIRTVPPGTNGGVSFIGTVASVAGGAFIGLLFVCLQYVIEVKTPSLRDKCPNQLPMVVVGAVCGGLGSFIDSFLGATVQATYYSADKQCIIKPKHGVKPGVTCVIQEDGSSICSIDPSVKLICGFDLLSNEVVNVLSTLITMALAVVIAPAIFCYFDKHQCVKIF